MRAVIIDTDMAGDDWMAILYLLKHPDVVVKAITVTGAGECHCAPGVANAFGLLELAGYADIPVTGGRDTPLRGTQEFPKAWREAVDSLYGLGVPEHQRKADPRTASQLIIDLIDSSSEPLTILAVGPLTNIAEAFLARPDLAKKVESIVIMGGAVFVAGNVNVPSHPCDNEHAEWNIFVDPYAAEVVLQSGAPVVLVSLDATDHAPVSEAFYERLLDGATTAAAQFVVGVLAFQYRFIISGRYYFWDPFAAVVMTNPEVTRLEEHRLRVVQDEGRECGRTVVDASGAVVKVAIGADTVRFEQVFFDVVNN